MTAKPSMEKGSGPMWVILPGLALAPGDYIALARMLPGPVRILDSWHTAVTGEVETIRAAITPENMETDSVNAEACFEHTETGHDNRSPSSSAHPQINLIGHSVGADAALEWALRYPAEIRSVVLIDPPYPHRAPRILTEQSKARPLFTPFVAVFEALAPIFGNATRRLAIRVATRRADQLNRFDATARYGTVKGASTIIDQWFESWDQQNRLRATLGERVDSLRVPILYLVGAGKRIDTFVEEQRQLAAMLNAHLVELPGENHFFPLSKPALVVTAIKEILGDN